MKTNKAKFKKGKSRVIGRASRKPRMGKIDMKRGGGKRSGVRRTIRGEASELCSCQHFLHLTKTGVKEEIKRVEEQGLHVWQALQI